jgi:UDP-N-acetylmuramyl tripeptide synthase
LAPGYFESSRRLIGPNLYFSDCGAVLEVGAASVAQCGEWEARLREMLHAMEWPEPLVAADRHTSGASLAFSAPIDQLFTATEINEWCWQSVACQTLALPLPMAPAHPATWDFDSALHTLRKYAAAESRRDVVTLLAIAAQHGLPAFYDEDAVSIGAGQGSRSWLLDALPASLADVDWTALHDIPTVLVTGSNGKTTTVRLLAAMFRAAGLKPGFNCTDGVFIDGEQVQRGDYSGPSGARQVLRDTRVQAAVLETARGGILRRGLAVDHANAGIVTNVSADHFGEYGVHDLARLADAKLVLARAIGVDGVLVLNADDPLLVAKSVSLSCPLAWFSLDDTQSWMHEQRRLGVATCGLADSVLWLEINGIRSRLGDVAAMPLAMAGSARYNIANIAGASLLAASMGIAAETIASVLAGFGSSRADNPGRLERWSINGASVFLDYAHNPEGLSGLLEVANWVREASGGRLGLLLGQAGNRDDLAIVELARAAAGSSPDLVVLKDLEGYLRGRAPGAVPALLHAELRRQGVAGTSLRTILPEVEAAQEILAWSRPGDVLVLPVHSLSARAALVAWLDARSGV